MKRSHDQAHGSKEPLPLAALKKQNQHLTQTSLKEHFRVTKPRHVGKENASDAGTKDDHDVQAYDKKQTLPVVPKKLL